MREGGREGGREGDRERERRERERERVPKLGFSHVQPAWELFHFRKGEGRGEPKADPCWVSNF